MKLLSLIVPVLNEEESIPLFYEAVQEVLRDEPYELESLFVDDGSTDKTLEIIEELHARDPRVRGISFSRNFGKELALAAGLQAARGDAVVPMDVDLQDPPALMRACLETSAFIVTRRHVDKKRLCAAAKTREDCQTVPQRSDGQRMGACTSSPAPCFWRRSEAQNRPA